MPYKTGGETHHGGVGNEKELVELMNVCPELNINKHLQFGSETKPVWGHLGGTTQKADCDVVVDGMWMFMFALMLMLMFMLLSCWC